MTMRVLQIQLRSLTAMDIVAYGGAAAGIGVALWQYAHTTAAAAGASTAGWSVCVQLVVAGLVTMIFRV